MQPRDMFARTYDQAKKNLEDGFISVGVTKRPEGAEEVNIMDKHPLIWIVAEYKAVKEAYAYQLSLKNKISQDELGGLKSMLDCLHDIIQDSIRNLSSEELLSINGMTKWNEYPLCSHSVISCLGEIGAVDLFDLLLDKIAYELSVKDWVTIFKDLKESYEGNALTERLRLSSSFLHRGDVCFVEMARSVLLRLIAINKLDNFFDKLFKPEFKYEDSHKITIDEALAFHHKNFMEEWNREKFIKKSVKFANSEYGDSDIDESVYGEEFDRFVTMHKYQDIFALLTWDFMIPYLIRKGEYQFSQPKEQGVQCARSLFSQSTQAIFEQNKTDNNCVVYDSLATNLLLFKRENNAVTVRTEQFSEGLGMEMTAEIKSLEFTINKKNKY